MQDGPILVKVVAEGSAEIKIRRLRRTAFCSVMIDGAYYGSHIPCETPKRLLGRVAPDTTHMVGRVELTQAEAALLTKALTEAQAEIESELAASGAVRGLFD